MDKVGGCMARKRNKENIGLPSRWCLQHGAYYYSVPSGMENAWGGKKKFRLGKTLPDACREWADHLQSTDVKNVGDLLDRYATQSIPEKAISSQSTNLLFVRQLRKAFGQMPLLDIKPKHVYQYIEKRRIKTEDEETGTVRGGLTVAQREIEVLSHAFTKAVEWGLIDRHPFKGEIRIAGNRPRNRYVEDWEIDECMKLTCQRKKGSVLAIQAYIQLKIITGIDHSDLLRLTMSDIKEDGIHIQRHKTTNSTGKRTIYIWTPELRAAVDMAKETRPAVSQFIFCKRNGEGYYNEETGRPDGWKGMWQRFMTRLLAETKVTERFTEHDLRAKAASDAETLDQARALLSHADVRTTDRIYRRKAEVVTPIKRTLQPLFNCTPIEHKSMDLVPGR